jgi:hypothetical protein
MSNAMAIFTLSTFDRGAPNTYIRYALTFACDAEQATAATEKLQKATKNLVNEIPMLAGTVTTNSPENPIVTVTLQQVNDFKAIIAHLESNHQDYAALHRRHFPPSLISGLDATPFANDYTTITNPCCAIQANFIEGGLILVIYLHHAVADIRGITTILRSMSEGLGSRVLDSDSLELEASSVSQARYRLSDGSGTPPTQAKFVEAQTGGQNLQQSIQQERQQANDRTSTADHGISHPDASFNSAAIFRFNSNILVDTANMINSRRDVAIPTHANAITPREALLAILWHAYVRARWPRGAADGVKTSMSFQVDIHSNINPPLDEYWMGNAEVTAKGNEYLWHLGMYYDVSTLERTSNIFHHLANSVGSDVRVRSRIEMMNASEDLQDEPAAQLILHDWTPVPQMSYEQMGLGLGLGRPDAIRRTGRGFGRNEMVLLPEDAEEQTWDVQVELHRDWLAAMLGDLPLRNFLRQ